MNITAKELAVAIRAYLGPRLSPETRDAPRWYIDIDSMASDYEILKLAEDIIKAAEGLASETVPA